MVEDRAKYLHWKIRERSKKKGYEECDITMEWLVEHLTPLKCELTGISLDCGAGAYGAFLPSIDRIDNSRGYLMDNCQIVAYGINVMRNNFDTDSIDVLATAWLDRNETDSEDGCITCTQL